MVRVVRGYQLWSAIAACLAAAGVLCAQDSGANSPAALQDTAAKRTAEWNTLTTGLELRLARLLPCDARARTSIDEVIRASDARIMALTSYWNRISADSKTQVEAIRGLLTQEEGNAEYETQDRTGAQLDIEAASAQAAALGPSLRQLPALADPQKNLDALVQDYRTLAAQAQERETSGAQLLVDLRALLKASQERQSAIEEHMKAIGAEAQRWSGYYAARQARAQIECSITNPGAGPAPAAPRPASRPVPQGAKP